MSSSIKTAVILAAGLGSRLGELKENKPKAFVKIGDESLIDRSIRLLLSKGITSIVIGTGYLSEQFDTLSKNYPQLKTLKNPDFATTGSMYTLYILRDLITGPFLLLEGDLLYESSALDQLLEDQSDNIILASDATHSGDEVFIQINANGLLERMSKERDKLKHVNGELVGITKLSKHALASLCTYAQAQYALGKQEIHYEDALVGIANEVNLIVKVVKDMAWCEIDDATHLKRALSSVYPKILERD